MILVSARPNSAVTTLNHAHSRWLIKTNCFKDDPRTFHPYHAPLHTVTLVTLKYDYMNFWLHNGLISENFKVILGSEWTYRQRYFLRFSCINRYAVDMRSLDRTCFPCRTISLSGVSSQVPGGIPQRPYKVCERPWKGLTSFNICAFLKEPECFHKRTVSGLQDKVYISNNFVLVSLFVVTCYAVFMLLLFLRQFPSVLFWTLPS